MLIEEFWTNLSLSNVSAPKSASDGQGLERLFGF